MKATVHINGCQRKDAIAQSAINSEQKTSPSHTPKTIPKRILFAAALSLLLGGVNSGNGLTSGTLTTGITNDPLTQYKSYATFAGFKATTVHGYIEVNGFNSSEYDIRWYGSGVGIGVVAESGNFNAVKGKSYNFNVLFKTLPKGCGVTVSVNFY